MMKIELVDSTIDPVESIEIAGKNCYNSQNITKGKLLKHCYESGHLSVLEFAHFHFKISGISRACANQLVRHRLASYAQRSQRYCNEENFEYVTPLSIKSNNLAREKYNQIMNDINDQYKALIDLGIAQEDARFVLPNSCTTVIDVDMNLRELVNFFGLRLCARAQWEIRSMAHFMKQEIVNKYPELEDILVPRCESDKRLYICPEQNGCGKHLTVNEIIQRLKEIGEVKRYDKF